MEHLVTGLELTVLGIGSVFAVLIILAGLTVLIGRLADHRDRPSETQKQTQDTPTASTPKALTIHLMSPTDQPKPEELAAIAVATRLHQIVRRRQAAPAMRAHQPGALPSRWLIIGRARQSQTWPGGASARHERQGG